MKKNLYLFAAAVVALGLASCSSDETIAENQSLAEANEISFRSLVSGMTRGADVVDDATTYGLKTLGFKVFANVYNGEGSEGANYFPETNFTWNGTTSSYTSEDKYYWPSSGALNFYAWSTSIAAQVTHSATTKIFAVVPASLSSATTAAGQTDLVFANTNNKAKAGTYAEGAKKYGADGVPINFRHAESKVIVKIKNSNPNLKFTIGNVAIGNLYGSGTFTYSGGNTGANTDGSGTLSFSDWATSGDRNVSYSLTMTSSESYNVLNGTTDAKNIVSTDNEMILIPQALTVATEYASSSAGAAFNGAFITVALKIQNTTNNAYIVGDGETYVTALWPLPTGTWNPGYKYTYTVDVAGGGYFTTNQTGTDEKLDPILDGAEIRFVNVTVDTWADGSNEDVENN